jgi:hypothetical protein
MDAYTPNAKGAIKRDDYYWQEQGQDFNKVMGLVDTGVATASLLAPEGAIDKLGKNMSDKILSPNLGKQFTRNTNNITRDYLKKSSNLIDTGKQLMDVQSMLKTFAPNQFNDLHKKLKVKQDLSPYKIPSQLNTEQFHLPEWDLTPYKPTSILETNL